MRTAFAAAALFLLFGCVQVDTSPLGRPIDRPIVPAEQVAVYRSASQVPGKYEEVALLTASGDYELTNETEMVAELRAAAGKAGANAVILDAVSEPTTGAKVAQAFLGTSADRKGKAIAIFVYYDQPIQQAK